MTTGFKCHFRPVLESALINRQSVRGAFPSRAGAGRLAVPRTLFTVNIRNRNTRAAYARAAGACQRWCARQGNGEIGQAQLAHVAAYVRDAPGGAVDTLKRKPMSRTDVCYIVRRRASDARIEAAIGCHTFRATGIH